VEPTSVTRPRVVIESPRSDAASAQADALAAAGVDAVVCEGPHHRPCPLLAGEPCDLVESADAVLFDLDLDRIDDRQVLRALRARYPELPIVAEVPTTTWRRRQHDLAHLTVVVPFSVGHTRDALLAAMRGEEPPSVATTG
jgi:CheY-like chemotaxis protein